MPAARSWLKAGAKPTASTGSSPTARRAARTSDVEPIPDPEEPDTEVSAAFEELVGLLRTTAEWRYVVREVDIRLARE